MKNSLLRFALLFSSIFFLTIACNNDDDNDGISVAGDGCFASWKMNGTDDSANDMALCIYLDNTLNLSTSTTGGKFQLQIDPITSTGTYMADASNTDINVIILFRIDGKILGSNNVIINVTELSNDKAKGNFAGDFYDISDIGQTTAWTVTDGKFESNF